MPLYEYECSGCRKTFERFERTMSSDAESKQQPAAKCPSCGSTKTARKLSAFAAVASGKSESSGSNLPHPGCHCGGGGCGGMN